MGESILNINVSYYRNGFDKTGQAANLRSILMSDRHQDKIRYLQSLPDVEAQKEYKRKHLPVFTPSALLRTRDKDVPLHERVIYRTPFMQVDYDEAAKPAVEIIKQLSELHFVAFAGRSCRGRGVFALIYIAEPERLELYHKFAIELFGKVGLPLDTSKGGNPTDLRFVGDSRDRYINDHATPLELAPGYGITPAKKQKASPLKNTYRTISGNVFDNAKAYAESKVGVFMEGNRHNFIFWLCTYLSENNVPQADAERWIDENLIPLYQITTNCITGAYKRELPTKPTAKQQQVDTKNSNKCDIIKKEKVLTDSKSTGANGLNNICTPSRNAFRTSCSESPLAEVLRDGTVIELTPEGYPALWDSAEAMPTEPELQPAAFTENKRVEFSYIVKREPESILTHKKWDQEISELEACFAALQLPTLPIELKQGNTITDVSKFISSHLATVKTNNGKRVFLPYLERLKELKLILLNTKMYKNGIV